ncbi:MAG TPA: hypothetical protein VMB71_12290 [Acetobacteraceae bacterium]|nr:hypothetical protein [Acetobacteraceae bacterium]
MSLRGWIYSHVFASLGGPYDASLIYAIAYVLVPWLFAWFLFRRGWFVRV